MTLPALCRCGTPLVVAPEVLEGRCSGCSARQRGALAAEQAATCPICCEPTHASESNDEGICVRCLGPAAILPDDDGLTLGWEHWTRLPLPPIAHDAGAIAEHLRAPAVINESTFVSSSGEVTHERWTFPDCQMVAPARAGKDLRMSSLRELMAVQGFDLSPTPTPTPTHFSRAKGHAPLRGFAPRLRKVLGRAGSRR